jgi:hypothetical protein
MEHRLISEEEGDEMAAAFYRTHAWHDGAELSRGSWAIVVSCPNCPIYPEHGLWDSAEIDNEARTQALGRDAEPRQFPGLRIRDRASA